MSVPIHKTGAMVAMDQLTSSAEPDASSQAPPPPGWRYGLNQENGATTVVLQVAHKRMESDLNYSYPRKIEQI